MDGLTATVKGGFDETRAGWGEVADEVREVKGGFDETRAGLGEVADEVREVKRGFDETRAEVRGWVCRGERGAAQHGQNPPGQQHVHQELAGSELPLPAPCGREESRDRGEEGLHGQTSWRGEEGHDAALFVPGRHERGAMRRRWRRLSVP